MGLGEKNELKIDCEEEKSIGKRKRGKKRREGEKEEEMSIIYNNSNI